MTVTTVDPLEGAAFDEPLKSAVTESVPIGKVLVEHDAMLFATGTSAHNTVLAKMNVTEPTPNSGFSCAVSVTDSPTIGTLGAAVRSVVVTYGSTVTLVLPDEVE